MPIVSDKVVNRLYQMNRGGAKIRTQIKRMFTNIYLCKPIQSVSSGSPNYSFQHFNYSTMNFRALNIREAHERPEAIEKALVMMVGLNTERIMQGLAVLETQKRNIQRTLRPVSDYSMPNVSDKVVRIILSYTDYIKRTVWSER